MARDSSSSASSCFSRCDRMKPMLTRTSDSMSCCPGMVCSTGTMPWNCVSACSCLPCMRCLLASVKTFVANSPYFLCWRSSTFCMILCARSSCPRCEREATMRLAVSMSQSSMFIRSNTSRHSWYFASASSYWPRAAWMLPTVCSTSDTRSVSLPSAAIITWTASWNSGSARSNCLSRAYTFPTRSNPSATSIFASSPYTCRARERCSLAASRHSSNLCFVACSAF
mmetsp:Transcript_12314/g.29434  ORF Transcript_12314/g.29434 Transcript_12314/m.29434 type:complete len:226 (+) Transcript_12314:983-1660(+)